MEFGSRGPRDPHRSAQGNVFVKTVFSDRLIKEYLVEALKFVPGISGTVDAKDISVANNAITIKVSCLSTVSCHEVALMAQRNLHYGLFRETDGRKFTINVLISSIK